LLAAAAATVLWRGHRTAHTHRRAVAKIHALTGSQVVRASRAEEQQFPVVALQHGEALQPAELAVGCTGVVDVEVATAVVLHHVLYEVECSAEMREESRRHDEDRGERRGGAHQAMQSHTGRGDPECGHEEM
jgi:hypothetical protein